MTRARSLPQRRKRRNEVLKLAKGFKYDRRNKYKMALDTVRRALHNAYKGRKLLKRNMRGLWNQRIGAAAKSLGLSYSRFMGLMKQNNILLNRKMLSEIAVHDFETFEILTKKTPS